MLLIVEPRNCRADVEQERLLRLHFRRELLQRRHVVRDPHAATVCCDDQIVLARMDENVVGPHGRVVAHELLPLFAAGQRDEQSEFGSDVQEILVLRIFANHLYVPERRQIVRDALKGRAVVVRDEDVGLQIVAAVAVHRDVGGRRIEERVFTKQEGARTRRETWPRRKAVGIRAEAAALGAGHVIVISLRRKAGKRRSQGTGIGGRLVKRRAVVYRERAVGIELVGVEVAECAAMEGIVAALGHHVDGAAGVASVLCIGGAGDNAELLHRVIHLKRHCLIAARSHVVGSIQQEAVARGPVSRDAERGPGQTRSLLHVVRIGWN